MGIDLATIPNDSKKLKLLIVNQEQKYLSQIEKLEKENEQLERKAEILVDEIQLLRHKIFGRSSEKLTEEEQLQMRLFDEGSEEAQPIETIEVPSYQRRKRGRRPLPESLPRVKVVHDIPEEEKICSCGARLVQIGEDVSEQLEFIPAKIWVARHIRPKYTCKACEGASVEDGEKVDKDSSTSASDDSQEHSHCIAACVCIGEQVLRCPSVLPPGEDVSPNWDRYSSSNDVPMGFRGWQEV
jgi:hypothetical protein